MAVNPDGVVLTELEVLPGAPGGHAATGRNHVSWWTPGETKRLFGGSEIVFSLLSIPACGLQRVLEPRLFSPLIAWDMRGSRIVIAEDREYVIHVLEEGRRVMTIERPIAPQPVTREMALRRLGSRGGRISRGCEVTAEEGVRALGFGRDLQAVSQVQISPDGDVWVLRGRVEDEARVVDVFSSDGGYLGTLPPDSPYPIGFGSQSRLLAVGKGFSGTPILRMYRVRKPSGGRTGPY